MSKFYQLEPDEWLEISSSLTFSETKVLLRLRTINPFGDRYKECSTKELSEDLKLNQRTVQKSIIKLGELDLIDFEFSSFKFKIKNNNEKRRLVDRDANYTPPNRVKEAVCTPLEGGVEAAEANCTPPKRSVRRDRSSKEPLSNSSTTSHTLKTIKTDQIRSEEFSFNENLDLDRKTQILEKPKSKIIEFQVPDQKTEIPEIFNPVIQEKLKQTQSEELDRKVKIANSEQRMLDSEQMFRDFIIRTVETERKITIGNREAYLNKVLEKDAYLWRSRYAESIKPKYEPKTMVIDTWRIEGGLISAMLMGDCEYVIQTLKNLPQIAEEILDRHPDWRILLCG